MDLRLGLQLPRFDDPGVDAGDLFERVAAAAVAGEESGFDHLFVMDHFWQLPALGPPDRPMLEGYSLLAGLAARTATAQLGTLVTGVTYRNPALLAKTVTTLDVISRGRALLGIGAAWYEEEHRGFGYEFPSTKERFDRLEEALHICRAMFTEDRPSFSGRHHAIEEAINVPRPLRPGGIPVLIGGSGEKRTLRLVAEHADASNLICAADEIPHKLEVLAGHCADVGRDPATVNTSWLGSVVVAPTHEAAMAKVDGFLGGIDARFRSTMGARLIAGDPDAVAERIAALFAMGLDGVVCNLPADPFDTEVIQLAGETLAKAAAG